MTLGSKEISNMEQRFRAQFINSLTGFKNLQLVGTLNTDGSSNLGIFSSVFHIGANPPLVGIIFRPESDDHDSLGNIRRTGEYTLNNVLASFYRQAHQTSARYPGGVSEFAECGFNEHFLDGFSAPFVKESSVSTGLLVKQITPLEVNGTTLVIGEVVRVILEDELLGDDGYIDQYKAGTLTLAGLDSYFETSPLERLPYAKP